MRSWSKMGIYETARQKLTRLTASRWITDANVGHVGHAVIVQRDGGGRIRVRGVKLSREVRHTCLVSLNNAKYAIAVDALGDGQGNTSGIIANNGWIRRNACGQQDEWYE